MNKTDFEKRLSALEASVTPSKVALLFLGTDGLEYFWPGNPVPADWKRPETVVVLPYNGREA